MSYLDDLNSIRNKIHKNIVFKAVSICPQFGGEILLFLNPVTITVNDHDIPTKHVLIGINCENGVILNDKDEYVQYQDIDVYSLAIIHEHIHESKLVSQNNLFI